MSGSPPQYVVLPARFEDVNPDDLVILIADMLQRIIAHNDHIPLSPVLEYLRRIVRYTNVERTCLLITLHYIDQICGRMSRFTVSSLTVHRFIVASIAVSSKALCDVFCTNTHYARVGGIRVAELNLLEKEFLQVIDWRLTCTRELLQEYYVNLARTHSSGKYKIAEPPAASTSAGASSPSDAFSPSPSPMEEEQQEGESGDVGVPLATNALVAQPGPVGAAAPTLEQNMAFAEVSSAADGAAEEDRQRQTRLHVLEVDPHVESSRSVRRRLE